MLTHKKIHSCKPHKAMLKPQLAREYFFLPPKKNFFPPFLFLIKSFSPTHGLTANPTRCASNVNHFLDSVCKLDTTPLQTDRRASANKGLKEMAGEVVNQTFVHLINSCGRLTVCASKSPLL